MPMLDLPDCRLHYRETGSGAPLLLLHGNFASQQWWAPQFADPPAGRRLIAPDLRGLGDSGRPGHGYDVPCAAADVLALLDALDIERCDVVGHSLGGVVALQLAILQPQRIRSLLLLTPAPADGIRLDHLGPLAWLGAERIARLIPTLTQHHATMDHLLPHALPGLREDAAQIAKLCEIALACDPAAIAGYTGALAGLRLLPALATLDQPVLVLAGALDPLVSPQSLEPTVAQLRHGALLIWSDCGHAPQLEQVQPFRTLLADWLADASAVLADIGLHGVVNPPPIVIEPPPPEQLLETTVPLTLPGLQPAANELLQSAFEAAQQATQAGTAASVAAVETAVQAQAGLLQRLRSWLHLGD
ncbi:MAG TPA: alpha/beta hydrolase [Plasticicumulans sp.]|nr:alpha/beta hydrolase [Plasticicumulans sp.]HNJ08161.1 alpha/beta hydrolase [Plasticicumulans sp.]